MAVMIGIPRGLFYHKYHALWKVFLEEIGEEIALSAETGRAVMDRGIASCVGEACLPVKAYFGHVLDVAPRADALLIPRYTSVSAGEYICPKFGGLPDMVRGSLPDLPPILSPEVNLHDGKGGGERAAVECGRLLGAGARASRRAYGAALQAYRAFRAGQTGVPANRPAAAPAGARRTRILLLGHCYTVADRYLNMDILRKLAALGVEAVTPEHFDGRALRAAAAAQLEKPMFWHYGTQALGCVGLLLERPIVDGVLHLTCFGCGVDSFVGFMAERRLRPRGVPFATVTLDEHTGEAGLETRLEAFADALGRKGAAV